MYNPTKLEDYAGQTEEISMISKSTQILFEKGNGLDKLLPRVAGKYPNCAMLQINTAVMIFLSFSAHTIKADFPKYLARLNLSTLSPSLNKHYQALIKLQDNDFDEAFKLYCQLVVDDPHDQIAILMLETVGFMAGKFQDMVAPYENLYRIHANNSTFLGMLSFLYSHVERHIEAKIYIKKALLRAPHNAWIQHVYVHTLTSSEELAAGVKFLAAHTSDWLKQNRFFEGHNWMHLCILLLQQATCDVNFILKVYNIHIWGAAKSLIFEQNNAFLTLLHLELARQRGLIDLEKNKSAEVERLWQDLALHATPFMHDYFTPYLTVTAILTVAKVNPIQAQLAVQDFRDFAKSHPENSSRYHAWFEIGLPILEGCMAYLSNDYAKAEEFLRPVYNNTMPMGHSDEQRSIFKEIYSLVKQPCGLHGLLPISSAECWV